MRVALLFIDGVGVGIRNPDFNPLARGEWLLSQFADGSGTALPGGTRTLLETTFGVPGRPQSATNQTAILTGEPAPRLIGKHVLGYPDAALRPHHRHAHRVLGRARREARRQGDGHQGVDIGTWSRAAATVAEALTS
jgi:hypothetical protein